jgi:GTP-binding protein
VERCAALVHVIDCATFEPDRDPLSDLDVIEAELAAYQVDEGAVPLADRPRLVVLHKVDVPEARELAELVRPDLEARGLEVFEVSSVSHEGLRELSFAMARLVAQARADRVVDVQPRVVIRPLPVNDPGFTVQREETADGPRFRVLGRPERWVQQTDFSNDEAVGYLADRLSRIGVEEALAKAGAVAGAEVVIGRGERAVLFDWDPTLGAGTGVVSAPRGADLRLEESSRANRTQRRDEYEALRQARRDARAELAEERRAGHWVDPAAEAGEEPEDDDLPVAEGWVAVDGDEAGGRR